MTKFLSVFKLLLVSIKRVLLVAIAALQFGSFARAEEVPAALVHIGDSHYFSSTAIVVDKKQRKLTLWKKGDTGITKIAEYQSDIGRKEGNKSSRGDFRTPEGIYFLQKQLEGKELDYKLYGKLAFTTDYPNLFDRRDGKTGNGIWLHAIPESETLERGSRGCVVVRNKSIFEISPHIDLRKTPIIIHGAVETVDVQKQNAFSQDLLSTLSKWQKAWTSKDIESYITFYSKDFESLKMDRDKWKQFKTELSQKYQAIDVELSEPVIYAYNGKMIIRTLQHYRSDQHEDFGEKILYMTLEDGSYKIIAEEWAPADKEIVVTEISHKKLCCQASLQKPAGAIQ